DDVIHQAIATLTDQSIRLLDWWDNFLRERFYSSGLALDDETRLIAYEAGRGLATLSWNLTVRAAPLEDGGDAADLDTRTENLTSLWQTAFSVRDIASLQHQIAALAKVLDAAYSDSNGSPAANGKVSPALNPALPSQSLQAVTRSIEYWRRSVE